MTWFYRRARVYSLIAAGSLSVQQTIFQGVTDQLRIRAHVHFLQDARPISADGLWTQRELVSDLGDGFSRSYHQHYDIFAFAKPFMWSLDMFSLQIREQ